MPISNQPKTGKSEQSENTTKDTPSSTPTQIRPTSAGMIFAKGLKGLWSNIPSIPKPSPEDDKAAVKLMDDMERLGL